MCTVTFIRVRESVFITSNRDEKHWRSTAIAPALYQFKKSDLLFPKDADAGGTWFAASQNGNAIVFLNGAWQKHIPNPPYRKSRGLILLDLAEEEIPFDAFMNIDLENIEPFTAIIWQDNKLFDCRWNGLEKFYTSIDTDLPHIWSSVTLYDDETIRNRKKWFEAWLAKNPSPTQDEILHFHQTSGDGDGHNDLLMNRNDFVFTVSITSASFSHGAVSMKYLDVRTGESHLHDLILHKVTAVK